MSVSILGAMRGPFPGLILSGIPFEILVAIPSVMSGSIPYPLVTHLPTSTMTISLN